MCTEIVSVVNRFEQSNSKRTACASAEIRKIISLGALFEQFQRNFLKNLPPVIPQFGWSYASYSHEGEGSGILQFASSRNLVSLLADDRWGSGEIVLDLREKDGNRMVSLVQVHGRWEIHTAHIDWLAHEAGMRTRLREFNQNIENSISKDLLVFGGARGKMLAGLIR